MGREVSGSRGVVRKEDKYEQNMLYKTLKELMKNKESKREKTNVKYMR